MPNAVPASALLAKRPERLTLAERAWLRSHRAAADAYEARWGITLF
jgi:hypothetical protein